MVDPIRILYVDDEKALLSVAKIFLERSGDFSVDTAPSARIALKSENLLQYNAIISDYEMPGMDGIAFLKEVRSRFCDIPFILFTGRGREEIVIQALNEGADFYLQKGGEPDAMFAELSHKVRHAVRRKHAEDERNRLGLILESSVNEIYIFDAETLRFINVNSGARNNLGYSLEELRALTPLDIKPEFTAEYFETLVAPLRNGEREKQVFTTVHMRKDGTRYPVEVHLQFSRAGLSPVFVAIILDITDRKHAETELLRNNEELSAAYEQIAATEEELRQNLDELMESRRSLEESEEKYRCIVETANEGIWSVDSELVTTFVNRKMADMLGYASGEMLGRAITEFMDPGEMPDNAKRLKNRQQGMSEVYERKFRHRDGSIRWMQISVTAIKDAAGNYAGSFAMISDITERKAAEEERHRNHEELSAAYEQITATEEELRANLDELTAQEKALRDSKKELTDIIEFLPDATFAINADGKVIAWNHAMEVMTGVDKAGMLNHGNFEYSLPLYHERRPILIDLVFGHDEIVAERYQAVKRDGNRLTAEIFTPHLNNGKGAYLWFTASPLYDSQGHITGAIESIREITEHKERDVALNQKNEELSAANEQITATEEELRQQLDEILKAQQDLRKSEGQYRTLFENTGTATVIIEENNIISLANAEFERLSGFLREDIENKKCWTEFVAREDREPMLARHRLRRQNHDQALTHYEFRFITKSGDIRDICLTIDVVPGTKKSIASLQDITGRKRVERELVSAQERLNKIHRLAHIGIWDWVIKTDTVTWSEELYGIAEWDLQKPAPGYAELSKIYTPDSWDRLSNAVTRALETGEPYNLELELVRPDCSVRWTNASGGVVRDATGTVIGLHGTLQDITDRKRVELELQKVHDEYTSLLGHIHDVYYRSDAEGRLVIASRSWAKNLGYDDISECLGKNIADTFYFDPAERRDFLKEVYNHGSVSDYEVRLKKKDGTPLWVSTSSYLCSDGPGRVPGVEGTWRDITERRLAGQALRESEEKYRALSENCQDYIMRYDRKHRHTYANPACLRISGMKKEQFIGKTHRELGFPQDLCTLWESAIERVFTTGQPHSETFAWDSVDGNIILDWRLFPETGAEGRVISVLGVSRDISKSRRAEYALRESEEKFRSIVETSPDMIWEVDEQGKFRYMSPVIESIMGYTPEEVLGKSILDLVPDEKKDATRQVLEHMVSAEDSLAPVEVPARHRDGRDLILEIRPSRLIAPDGKLAGLRGVTVDITSRRRMEDLLRDSLERYQLILESANEGIMVNELTPEGPGKFLETNESACRILGMTSEELQNLRLSDLDTPEMRDRYPEIVRGLQQNRYAIFQTVYRTRDNITKIIEIGVSLFEIGGRPTLLSVIRDITEQKIAQQALLLANRQLNLLICITRHDIRNQIFSLKAYLDLSKMTIGDTEKTAEYITLEEEVVNTIERQINFTKEYGDLGARPPVLQNVMSCIQMAINEIDLTGIGLEVRDLDTVEIIADPLLRKVFFNLADNALRHGGGALKQITFSSRETDIGLILLCEDDGAGIAADEKEMIFERGYGKNTGYGLFLIREILAITSITITETGEPGKGARFEMRVPKGMYRHENNNPGQEHTGTT